MERENNIIHDAEQCRENIEERILALAEGNIDDPAVIDELYLHMVNCSACRHLYEDYFIIGSDLHDGDDEHTLPHIGVILSEGGISLTSDIYAAGGERAQVMNGASESGVVDLSVPLENSSIEFRIIKKGRGVSIEVDNLKPDDKAYLISESGRRYSHPRNGTAVIDEVERGGYLLSINLRQFVVVEVT